MFCWGKGIAQLSRLFKKDAVDSSYYEVYDTIFNGRFFMSQKLTNPALIGTERNNPIKYHANGAYNIGPGITHGWLSLNLALNFKFINNDDAQKGKTRFLDLHTQAIGRPYCVDLYGQFYYGNYLIPESGRLPQGSVYPQRPDINTQLIGAAVYFFPNWRRFSYAAAITQRDWQKKSAGSLILGGEVFYSLISGDSSLIPPDRTYLFPNGPVTQVRFAELGLGGGYAYSLVIHKHWFVHASIIGTMSTGWIREMFEGKKNEGWYGIPNFTIRPSFGYNSRKWNGSVMLFANRVNAGQSLNYYRVTTSNLRVTLAYRFIAGHRLHKRYDRILKLNPFWKGEAKN